MMPSHINIIRLSLAFALTATPLLHANAKKASTSMDDQVQASALTTQEETQETDSALILNDVVVTGTRTPKLLKDTPVMTRLISSADIEKADATNIEDLMQEEMPGVEFSYAMNQKRHINMSGFGGQSVLFLIDGERMAGETMDDVDFSRLDMSNVARIEIVKGAASALYGSNASGGVINIITKESQKPWHINLHSRFARHNALRSGGSFSVRGQHMANTLTVNHTNIDGYDLHNADMPSAQVVTSLFADRTWNFKNKLTWSPTSALQLTARAGYYFREITRSADSPEHYRDFSAGMRGLWRCSSSDNIELSYSFDQYDKSDYYRIPNLDIRDYRNVQHTTRLLYHHYLNNDIFTAGADFTYDYLLNANLNNTERSQESADAFLQYDCNISPRWEIVGALRYDYFSDSRESSLTPKINARYKATDDISLRAGYGMGFRSPSLKEKYYNFDMAGIWIVLGNPNLKPERSHNFNVSAEYAHAGYNITISSFYNKIDNKLATGVPHYLQGDISQLYLDYINLDSYSVYGGELSLQGQWNNGIKARLGYAYCNERLVHNKEGLSVNSQYIPARKHSLSARIDWERNIASNHIMRLSLNGRFASSVENIEYVDYYDMSQGTKKVEYPAYTLWKMSAAYLWPNIGRLTISVDNMFNYKPKYYYFNSPMTDGTNLMIGFAVDVSGK